jgi:hypothetical protein
VDAAVEQSHPQGQDINVSVIFESLPRDIMSEGCRPSDFIIQDNDEPKG